MRNRCFGAGGSGVWTCMVNMNLKESGMNWMITIAGFVGLFTTIGHFAVGSKSFLKPMLEASFDDIPKKVMHCVFHYV